MSFAKLQGAKRQCIFIAHPMNSIFGYQKSRRSLGLFFKFSAKRQKNLGATITQMHSNNEETTKCNTLGWKTNCLWWHNFTLWGSYCVCSVGGGEGVIGKTTHKIINAEDWKNRISKFTNLSTCSDGIYSGFLLSSLDMEVVFSRYARYNNAHFKLFTNLLQSHFIEITPQHMYFLLNLLHIFRRPFYKSTSRKQLLNQLYHTLILGIEEREKKHISLYLGIFSESVRLGLSF